MNNILKNKKMIIISAVIIVILILVIIILLNNNSKKNDSNNLNDKLIEFGSRFYEEKYYSTVQDKQQLSNFNENGISISLTDINVILPYDEELKNLLNKKKCSLDNTKLSIYPESPYGEKNYKIKVELACEK